MKIIVLGGNGFVGKNLVDKLKNSIHEVYALSRSTGLDLTNLEQTKNTFKKIKPDTIINCAAHVGSLHYVTEFAANVIHDNALMALNLYKACSEINPDIRIINPLSNCSYPGNADIHFEPDWWQGEVHDSVFSYGNSKKFIYILARCYQKQYNVRTINFLIPNTFGPGDHTDPNKCHALNGMIIRMIKAQKEKQKIFEIWGTGKPIREWAYIDDVIHFLIKGTTIETDLTYPVNIAQNKGYSIKESAELIADAVGFSGKLIFNTTYQDGAPIKILDDKKFRSLFPDYTFYNHQKGIKNTVAYYKKSFNY
ncbi:MAG: NAD-dependent epimerase/dehydratase family protein [Candidatus Margulisiibacteriota bacterium]|jgi:GDP-L-fucose synthase